MHIKHLRSEHVNCCICAPGSFIFLKCESFTPWLTRDTSLGLWCLVEFLPHSGCAIHDNQTEVQRQAFVEHLLCPRCWVCQDGRAPKGQGAFISRQLIRDWMGPSMMQSLAHFFIKAFVAPGSGETDMNRMHSWSSKGRACLQNA